MKHKSRKNLIFETVFWLTAIVVAVKALVLFFQFIADLLTSERSGFLLDKI